MAPALVNIIMYPRGNDTFFKLDYYLSKHIPFASEIWNPYGVHVLSISTMDEASGYHLVTVLGWDSKEGYENSQKDKRNKEIWDDVYSGSFTNVKPVVLTGNSVL